MLSENTKVTIGLIIAIVGGVVFVTKSYFLSESNAASITELQQDQSRIIQDLAEIKADTRFMKEIMMKERGR
jgi:hypothetical protein